LIEDEVTGWTFYPDDPGQIYDALNRAMQTMPDRLALMRDEARKRALAITPEVIAEKILQVVEACKRDVL